MDIRECCNESIIIVPDIHLLAAAPDAQVFKLWEGLGYYTRCRNLIATARYISSELKGQFPADYISILSLKGIGPYTAAAISSFAFNLPHAVVDGNVFRVLSRIFGIDKPVDSADGKLFFASLANELLSKKYPGLYNQAIMDFGASICKPKPLCQLCPFSADCVALRDDRISELPVKGKKLQVRKRWFYYFIVESSGELAITQRNEKDIWQGLFEFPMVEAPEEMELQNILHLAEKKELLMPGNYETMDLSNPFRQLLSHQAIYGRFIQIKLKKRSTQNRNWIWVHRDKISKYPFPKFIHLYMQQDAPPVVKKLSVR